MLFQSTLPRGSDGEAVYPKLRSTISIHAPSRERQGTLRKSIKQTIFQSTLPRGSDFGNRRLPLAITISIHAPSRERPLDVQEVQE